MRYYSAEQVADSLTWPRLLSALRAGFREGGTQPPRHHHRVTVAGEPDGVLLLMPAWTEGGHLGLKMATAFPGNPARGLDTIQATYVLASSRTGVPLATLDGGELTARRTAAASALASTFLSRPDASRLLVVGTGRLAPLVALAHKSVRPIGEVVIWGRDPAKAGSVRRELERQGLPATVSESLEASVREADIVSCVTSATEPLVQGQWLRAGAHLDLIGSYTEAMREADGDAVARSRVFVDSREAALDESGELLHALREGLLRREDVQGDLFELCRGEVVGRATEGEITLFKSVGLALEDLQAAIAVHEAQADSGPEVG